MKFELSPELDSNKIFLVKRSELEGRFDPHFHEPKYKIIEKKLNLCRWPLVKLKELFEINRGGSPRPIQKYITNSVNGLNWIKIGDAKGVDKYITKTKQKIKPEGAKYSRKVFPEDFILSNSMSFGKPYIMKITGYIHDGWLLFRSTSDKTEKDFLHTLLGTDCVYKLFKKNTIGGVVENLNIDLVKNIKIPIPTKEIQNKIIAKMDMAYTAKKQKEMEAQRLLDSIDGYILSELGIALPEQEENTIQNRIFTRRLSEVSGGRFDPFFSSLNKQDKSGKYEFCKLKELAFIRKGDSITSNDVIDGNVPVIAGGQTSPYSHNISNCDGDVITVSASGAYSGFIWYHETPIFASDCSVIFSKNTDQLGNSFLFEYLKSEQQDIYNLQQGAGQPHVYPSDLEKIKIPVPPIEKQDEVVTYITSIRNQAKQLQQQAREELEQAKKETEAMIMGEL